MGRDINSMWIIPVIYLHPGKMNDAVDTLWCCLELPWMGNKKIQLNPGKMNWLCVGLSASWSLSAPLVLIVLLTGGLYLKLAGRKRCYRHSCWKNRCSLVVACLHIWMFLPFSCFLKHLMQGWVLLSFTTGSQRDRVHAHASLACAPSFCACADCL